jgi:membrane-bound serine protease (ClpP class)
LLAALVGATLFFAPHYLEGLAEHWEIGLFILGLVLIALEVFVIPGFGVAGILGVVMMMTGLTLSLLQNVVFDFTFAGFDEAAMALFRVSISIIGTIVLLVIFGRNILHSEMVKSLMLQSTQPSDEGFTVAETTPSLIGLEGMTATPLHPSGKIEIDGTRYDAESHGEFIDTGKRIKVVGRDVNHWTVEELKT